jgi:hypothetical protein
VKGHWSRSCRTPKHLADLYQQNKGKGKDQHESHFTIEPEAQPEKCDNVSIGTSGGDVQMDDSDDDLLRSDYDIFGDLQ